MSKINFAFFGTPDIARDTLEILKKHGYLPSLIITSPDARQGRKMILTPPPVKVWAQENNIPFIQNLSELKGDFDLFIVVAYGKILSQEILDMPKVGAINIHYSLLPKYRGASPVESAILNGENETGVTIQKMAYKMDAGPILAVEKTPIGPEEKAPELRKRLIALGGELLVKTLNDKEGWVETPQEESEATFCKKIKKEDGEISLDADPVMNYNKFRAYAAWPRTFFFRHLPAGRQERIIITQARLDNNKFIIEKIIPEGGKEIDYKV